MKSNRSGNSGPPTCKKALQVENENLQLDEAIESLIVMVAELIQRLKTAGVLNERPVAETKDDDKEDDLVPLALSFRTKTYKIINITQQIGDTIDHLEI